MKRRTFLGGLIGSFAAMQAVMSSLLSSAKASTSKDIYLKGVKLEPIPPWTASRNLPTIVGYHSPYVGTFDLPCTIDSEGYPAIRIEVHTAWSIFDSQLRVTMDGAVLKPLANEGYWFIYQGGSDKWFAAAKMKPVSGNRVAVDWYCISDNEKTITDLVAKQNSIDLRSPQSWPQVNATYDWDSGGIIFDGDSR